MNIFVIMPQKYYFIVNMLQFFYDHNDPLIICIYRNLYYIKQINFYYNIKQNFMARKVKKSIRKPKLVRSSSIQKTIDEGKDYISRVDQRLRLRRNKNVSSQPKTTKINKAKNQKKTKKQPASRARKALPVITPVPVVPLGTPILPILPVGNVSRSASRNLIKTSSKNSQIIEQQLHDRLTKHKANFGKLNFSLRWWDPNDLDLHVTCPCNTIINYINKKCTKCGGQLDIDMNNPFNPSLQPVEHVYFNNPKRGLYKFYVKYYSGPKQYQGVKGGVSSRYALSLHEDVNQIFRYEDNVSQKQTEMHYDYNF